MSQPGDPADQEQPTLVEAQLTPAEVVELWSFLHGDIMDDGIRQQLHRSLGLCPRHTWGYAVVEIELWQTGAGIRGGHQPGPPARPTVPHPPAPRPRHRGVRLRRRGVRLRRLASSMTKDGLPATPNDDASWVEALGWFAGWQVPLALTRADR